MTEPGFRTNHLKWFVLSTLLGAIACGEVSGQYTNGIYAEFNTSMGSFTCRLEYALAPKTCANFIGLATGQRSWLDLQTGITRTNPFYNGQIIHRVVSDFIIQGGSPNRLGTDGPGYTFQDEFHPSLRHDAFGTLSMANNGPDSNGSQYFLTVANTPFLNDRHSVFGRLYGGSNVVYTISRVATNASSKPLVDVNVTSVAIRRIGPDAQAFNVAVQGLPTVTNLNLQARRTGNSLGITFSNRLNADNRIYASTNLVTWTATELGIETAAGFGSQLIVTPNSDRGFYRMGQIQYPTNLFTPRNILSRTIVLTFQSGASGFLALGFDGFGGGGYNYNNAFTGPILGYTYEQDAYRARIYSLFTFGLPVMDLHLAFTNATSGTFKGTIYDSITVATTGVFVTAP